MYTYRKNSIMAPIFKNSRKSLSNANDKENAYLHSVSEFHSRIRRRESIRLKYKVSFKILHTHIA